MSKLVEIASINNSVFEKEHGNYLLMQMVSKNFVQLFFPEDAKEIVKLLIASNCKDDSLLEENYWKNYNNECKPKIRGTVKVVNRQPLNKHKSKKWFPKYDLKSFNVCPPDAKCGDSDHACVPIVQSFSGLFYSCACLPSSSKVRYTS